MPSLEYLQVGGLNESTVLLWTELYLWSYWVDTVNSLKQVESYVKSCEHFLLKFVVQKDGGLLIWLMVLGHN